MKRLINRMISLAALLVLSVSTSVMSMEIVKPVKEVKQFEIDKELIKKILGTIAKPITICVMK